MVEKIGEAQGLDIYYDEYQEDNNFLMGCKEGKLTFVIGNSKDLTLYEKAIKLYYKKLKYDNQL